MRIQALALLLALSAAAMGCADRNVAVEVPETYTGWVTIRHSAKECGPVEKRGIFQNVVVVQANGKGCSSQWQGFGNLTMMFFYYVDPSGKRTREIKATGWDEGNEVWERVPGSNENEILFYVGSEASYRRNGSPRPR